MNSQTHQDYRPDRLILTHRIGPDLAGRRLDAFLKHLYRKRSRESLKKAISDGRVTLARPQGKHLSAGRPKPSSVLLEGDEVRIEVVRRPEPAVSFEYKILHEDDALLIVDKPAQLPVHPAGSYFFNTLLVHLRTRGYKDSLDAQKEYFLAHRIDRETSGLLILAKSAEVCEGVMEQFRSRTTYKRYLAVVHGRVEKDEFAVSLPIGKDVASKVRLKMGVVPEDQGGLTAHTDCRVLERGPRFTLVECLPKTGRQHQIRVHLAAVGHPLVGDKLYSVTDDEAARFYDQPFRVAESPLDAPEGFVPNYAPRYISPEVQSRLVLDRHALHNAGIGFRHPLTGQDVRFESPLPAELEALVKGRTSAPASAGQFDSRTRLGGLSSALRALREGSQGRA